jgi:hypothetical protein
LPHLVPAQGRIPAERDVDPLGEQQRGGRVGAGVESGEELQLGSSTAGRGQHERRREARPDDVDRERWRLTLQLPQGCVVQCEQLPRPAQQHVTGRCERDLARCPVEQPRAGPFLQPLDIATECLLGEEQPLRGAAEVQFLGHHNEVAQQPHLQVAGHDVLCTPIHTAGVWIIVEQVLDLEQPPRGWS